MRKRGGISHLAFILRNKVQGKRRKELGNFGLVSTPLPYVPWTLIALTVGLPVRPL